MSHRGGSLEHVENSLPAFRYSANVLKVDLLELDCQLTKDGQVVIFHDDSLSRMCMSDRTVRDFYYSDLPKLIPPSNLPKHVLDNPDSTRIPLLDDLLKEFPQYPMQIDVKNGPEELVVKVGNLIKKYERERQTVWGSFRYSTNKLCYKHFGTQIPLFYDIWSALGSLAMWSLGLWKIYEWFGTRYSCLIFPHVKFLARKGWFSKLNSIGIPILIFGKNGSIHTIEEYNQVKELGVNGICSDRPSLLKEYLLNNKLMSVNGTKNKSN